MSKWNIYARGGGGGGGGVARAQMYYSPASTAL